ncbi:hypothetical protein Hanom_Chr06g00547461 [Helianthus anomalus]
MLWQGTNCGTYPKIEPFKDVVPFLKDSRIYKALTDRHKCYGSHVRFFWNAAHYVEDEKAIHSAVRIKDENDKDVDIPVKITMGDVRRVFNLKDKDEDPIIGSERLCKGFWLRMGHTGFINDEAYTKSKFYRPYKFLVHCVIHALGHTKGAYDEACDYIMNIISSLVLNRPYNISQVIFNHMMDNIKGERYVQYPNFVQMLIDDQVHNLSKDDSDELPLDHMDSETLNRLDVYRGGKKENEPKHRQKFAAIKKPDYVTPHDDKWRHDDNGSDDESKRMEPLVYKKTRWWFVKEKRSRKRILKVTMPKVVIKGKTKKQESQERLVDKSFESLTENVNVYVEDTEKKKSPPHLVDEPVITPQEIIEKGVDLLNMSFVVYKSLSTSQVAKDAAKAAENVETEAGGESLKETFVEGEVYTDSSETKSEIDLTQMAPT